VPKALLIAIGGGLTSAVFYLSFRSGFPGAMVLTYLAPVPVLAVGLSSGFRSAVIAAAVANLAILIGVHAPAAGMYAAITAIPALITVRLALLSRPTGEQGAPDWYPSGHLIAWFCAYGLVLLAFACFYFLGEQDGIEGASRRMLQGLFKAVMAEHSQTMAIPIDALALFLPGMLLLVWLMITILNAIFAQNILLKTGHALRPAPAYSEFQLPIWLSIALPVAILLTFLGGSMGMFGRNAALLLSTPFFLLGLAVIHTLSRRFPSRGAILAALYFLLIIVGWLSAAIVILGVIEHWISLRQRYAPPGGNQENE
jgi:hypothetical protein